jgi:hypothetical protein
MAPLPSHFTTTISQSLALNKANHNIKRRSTVYGVVQCHPSFATVPQFIGFLAREYPDRLAAECASPTGGVESLSTESLLQTSRSACTEQCSFRESS